MVVEIFKDSDETYGYMPSWAVGVSQLGSS